MFTARALRAIHDRAHRSLAGLLAHCRQLSSEELNRPLDGFGLPSVQRQLHHALAAERYWLGVLEGRIDVDDDADRYPEVAALETLRGEVHAATDAHLAAVPDAALELPRPMLTWGGKERVLVPAHVIMRTVTHLYQHQGQVTAMCRLLGRPVPPGLDYDHAPTEPPPG